MSHTHVHPGLPASARAPTEDQLRDLEEEKEAIRREYEQRIAELKSQFSQEQADKTRLEEELQKLQQTKNAQLAAVEVCAHAFVCLCVCPCLICTRPIL